MANKKGAGRPTKEFSEDDFKKLCVMWCTQSEICSFFGTTDKTLDRWCKRTFKMNYSEAYKKFSEEGNISLRRMQRKRAMDGSVPMLIWLGKQYLHQTDKQETRVTANDIKDDALSESLKKVAEELKSDDI